MIVFELLQPSNVLTFEILQIVASDAPATVKNSEGTTTVATLTAGQSYNIPKHTISNSDDSFSVDAEFDVNTELADITFDVYVNAVLNQSGTLPSQVNNILNITA